MHRKYDVILDNDLRATWYLRDSLLPGAACETKMEEAEKPRSSDLTWVLAGA